MASVYSLNTEYILDKSAHWLLWAYKNAVEMQTEQLKFLLYALTGQDFDTEPQEPTETNLKNIGIGNGI